MIPRRPLEERLWEQIDRTGECWLWTGCVRSDGYGAIGAGGRGGPTLRPHRVAYELLVGPIPDGLTLDHLCCVTTCCNPAHLEPVTSAVNIRRATARRTHCRRGHEFTPENTIVRPLGRECRTCRLAGRRQRRAIRRQYLWTGGE